jgi:GNAT superfamily N-acetyltransferase
MKPVTRPAKPADHDFIAATWSTCWGRPPEASCVTPAAWRTAVWASVPAILARPDVRVLVAADADTADHVTDLFGWLAWKPRAVECVVNGYTRRPTYRLAEGGPLPLVFCAYVKRDYRRNGIARSLFRAAGIDLAGEFVYACHTRAASALADAGKIRATWCPALGRLPQERNRHGRSAEEPDADAA